MNLTRLAFLKTWLAIFGVNQAASNDGLVCWEKYPDGKGIDIHPCPQTPCKEGEERCPLGHCQKPELGWFMLHPTAQQLKDGGDQTFEQVHVCSVCGVVYVPKP